MKKIKFNDTNHLETLFLSIYSKDKENIEEAIQALRESGASQLECVIVVKKTLKLSMEDADFIVIYSKAWETHREHTEELRQVLYEAWEEAGGDEIIEL